MTADEWGDFLRWWPIWSPLLLLVLGGTSTGIWVIVNRRGGEKAARKNPLPPTWPEMWARIDAQDQRIEDQDVEIGALKDEIRDLKSQKIQGDRERDLMMQHILALEFLVPNPPGPPARPSWSMAS